MGDPVPAPWASHARRQEQVYLALLRRQLRARQALQGALTTLAGQARDEQLRGPAPPPPAPAAET